jgi:AcrR family transcriptional regulator
LSGPSAARGAAANLPRRSQSGPERPAEPRPADRLLVAARDLLREHGLGDLTMASIAERAGCSRPAVYQYFDSREEVVAALAIESAALRNRFYALVPGFSARPRERLVALAEVDAILYPEWPVLEETTYANAVRGRVSPERRAALVREQRVAYESFSSCTVDALRAGDLALPRGVNADHLIFTLATFSTGLFAPVSRGLPDLESARPDPRAAMRRLGSAFLDGVGWRPLTTEWDYRGTLKRIYAQVFTAEFLDSLGLESSRSNNQARPRDSSRSVRPSVQELHR